MVSLGLTWSHFVSLEREGKTEREPEREKGKREGGTEGERGREGEREREREERGRDRERDTHIQLICVWVLSVFTFCTYYLLSF